MTPHTYLEYLESPEWWATRRRALARAGYQCDRCGDTSCLEVHHRTYEHLGDEPPDDLEVLCRLCHQADHAPRNRQLRARERDGQQRLFDRWLDPKPVPARRVA